MPTPFLAIRRTPRARVLDLGFGGVAIELDSSEELPENLLAVLRVTMDRDVSKLGKKLGNETQPIRKPP